MRYIYEQCQSILDPALPWISNVSNILAILYHEISDLNWVGVYFTDPQKQLCFLGPFQGKVACTKIPYGKGVVGTCAQQKKTLVVNDVHAFPGHIACDSASRSEIVIPLYKDENIIGVLDIDSPSLARFQIPEESVLQKTSDLISELLSRADCLW